VIEARAAYGFVERLPALTRELLDSKPEVIVTFGTTAAQAAKAATNTTPIVMAFAGDPVGTGLVASVARPGGNVTGMSLVTSELPAKRLELLKEIMPKLTRLTILGDISREVEVQERFSWPSSVTLSPCDARIIIGVVAMNNTAVRSVALLLCLFTAPFAAEAQKAGKVYRIGVLDSTPVAPNTNLDAFRQGLRELGYVEGQNLVIEYRSPAGRQGAFPDLAAELVRLKVDLILATPAHAAS